MNKTEPLKEFSLTFFLSTTISKREWNKKDTGIADMRFSVFRAMNCVFREVKERAQWIIEWNKKIWIWNIATQTYILYRFHNNF